MVGGKARLAEFDDGCIGDTWRSLPSCSDSGGDFREPGIFSLAAIGACNLKKAPAPRQGVGVFR
jgi:hypothetical protein